MDYLEGKNPVWEALHAGRPIHRIYVQEGMKDHKTNEIVRMAKQRNILLDFVSPGRIKQVAQTGVHQGIVAVVGAKEFVSVEEILKRAASSGEPPLLLLLDQVEDPHNLGSLIRTAEAAGVHGVIIPQRRAAGLTATVAKVSSGALEFMPVAQVTNLCRTMQFLKEKGIWLAGAEAGAGKYCYDEDFKGPLGIVLGSEGHGLRTLIKKECDLLVKIPMHGKINSLNVSVAGGILLYEVMRQRAEAVSRNRKNLDIPLS